MADPTKGKIIAITVTNGSAGEKVTVSNLSRSSAIITETLNSSKQAVINTANVGVNWQAGDTIHAQISGRINQVSEKTLSGGGVNVTLNGSANTTLPAVNM
ncbi:hypothetical protein HY571_01840 [Candidatus Micrarchaeota archaeon]|nr:hypothetical protein [Candidatus Micrarchaeota archaeon]